MSDVHLQSTRCATCGVIAPREQLVVERGQTLCPYCLSDPARIRFFLVKELPDLLAGVLLIATWMLFSALGVSDVGVPLRWVILIGLAVMLVLIVIHEAGHGFAAMITGRPVVAFVFGRGRHRLARFRLWNVIVEIRANPSGAVTYAVSRPGQSGEAFFILGGVSAEALVLVAAYFWNPQADLLQVARLGLIVFAAHDIVSNLWPRTMMFSRSEVQSTDGRLLWLLVRGRSAFSEVSSTASAADVEAILLAETDDAEVSRCRAAADFARNPDRRGARYRHGLELLGARRWSDANQVLQPLAADSHVMADKARASLLNNLAWSAVMSFDAALLDDADRWSAEAVEVWPVNPSLSGSRGAVLVMTGRPDLGMPLLLRAYRCHSDPRSKALVSGFGALGAAAGGDRLMMRQRYAAMIKQDPTCVLRRQVEKQIAGPEVSALAALVCGEDGSLDTAHLSDAEQAALPAMAKLALAFINGFVPDDRLADDAIVEAEDGASISAGGIRAAADTLLASHRFDDGPLAPLSRRERARRSFMKLIP